MSRTTGIKNPVHRENGLMGLSDRCENTFNKLF